MIQVFVKTNDNNEIIEINSNIFIDDFTEWTLIDEGYGDKYAHAQNLYLDKPIISENGCWNFKLENKKVVAIADKDKVKAIVE